MGELPGGLREKPEFLRNFEGSLWATLGKVREALWENFLGNFGEASWETLQEFAGQVWGSFLRNVPESSLRNLGPVREELWTTCRRNFGGSWWEVLFARVADVGSGCCEIGSCCATDAEVGSKKRAGGGTVAGRCGCVLNNSVTVLAQFNG